MIDERAKMKPIKTEYKGIVFDSKSEAVFARTLDIAGVEWIYHPAEHCGHAWDFLVFPTHFYKTPMWFRCGGKYYTSKSLVRQLESKPMLIEYKPSPPTDTYIENLTEKMRSDPVESIIVWGSPWKDGFNGCCYVSYPIFSSHSKYGWGDFSRSLDNDEDVPFSYRHEIGDILRITNEMALQAKEYRFDLIDTARTQTNRGKLCADLVELIPKKLIGLIPEYRSIVNFMVFDDRDVVACVWRSSRGCQESEKKIDSIISAYGFGCIHTIQ
jgi:hypothetical protein